MASSARPIDNTIRKDGSKFSGVLKNPTLTEVQAVHLQRYLDESSKLVNLKNELEGVNKGDEEVSLSYNSQHTLDEKYEQLQFFIQNHDLQSVIDDYFLKEYLSPLNNELQGHFKHLYDKVLNFFIDQKLIPEEAREDFTKHPLNRQQIEAYFEMYLDNKPQEKETKETKKMLRRINQIETLREIIPQSSLDTQVALKKIKEYFTPERQAILRDIGEEGYKVTKTWAAKEKVVNKINAILDRYQREIYTPHVAAAKRFLP